MTALLLLEQSSMHGALDYAYKAGAGMAAGETGGDREGIDGEIDGRLGAI